jgi:tRNA nucleotidyltransferase (CCA-adding enzyme)
MADKASDGEDVRDVKRDDLLERLRALPAGAPLLDALGGEPGVHLVGGAVRDLLLGREPVDLDLVVEGAVRPVAERLGGRVEIEHDRFGTAAVELDGRRYDLVTARAESYSHPGALPEVRPGTLAEDLRRRDFTVHACALELATGELTPVDGALDDLDARRLRVLHDGSFRDDATRLLRLARYGVRLSFAVEPHTAALAGAAIDCVGTVSGQRLGAELRLALREPDPLATLERIGELGVDRAIHPALGLDRPLAERALALLPDDGRPDLVVLAAFAGRVVAGELPGLLTRLGFTTREARPAVALARELPDIARDLAAADRPSAIAALLGNRTVEEVALVGALGPEAQARRWLEELRHVRLGIDGADLLAAGVPEGPAVGYGLLRALAAKLEGQARTREEELAAALLAAREHPAG